MNKTDMENNTVLLKDSFFYKKDNCYERVFLSEILCVRSEGSYCKISTKKQQLVLSMNLKSFLEKVNYEFLIRIHHSYAININKISAINGNEIVMGEIKVPIGKKYKKILKEVLHLL